MHHAGGNRRGSKYLKPLVACEILPSLTPSKVAVLLVVLVAVLDHDLVVPGIDY